MRQLEQRVPAVSLFATSQQEAVQPWMIDTTRLLFRLLALYLLVSLFFHPYGVSLIGSAFFRFADVIALLILGLCGFLLLRFGSLNATFLIFWPILPLMMMDVLMPLSGAIVYSTLDGLANGFRIAVMHGLVVSVVCFVDSRRLELLLVQITLVLQIALVANLIYCGMQIAVQLGALPDSVLITRLLKPFSDGSVRDHKLRPSGFFRMVTDVADLGIVGLAYFGARFQKSNRLYDLLFALLGILLILLSTARAAYAAMIVIVALILLPYVLSLKPRTLLQIGRVLIIGGGATWLLFWWLGTLLDVEQYFSRIIGVTDTGVAGDNSMFLRTEKVWPRALYIANNFYPHGTLLNPHDVIGALDSGYLAYFVQGRWLALLPVLWLYASLTYLTVIRSWGRRTWAHLYVFYLLSYIVLTMVVSVPLHSPMLLFMMYM